MASAVFEQEVAGVALAHWKWSWYAAAAAEVVATGLQWSPLAPTQTAACGYAEPLERVPEAHLGDGGHHPRCWLALLLPRQHPCATSCLLPLIGLLTKYCARATLVLPACRLAAHRHSRLHSCHGLSARKCTLVHCAEPAPLPLVCIRSVVEGNIGGPSVPLAWRPWIGA